MRDITHIRLARMGRSFSAAHGHAGGEMTNDSRVDNPYALPEL